MAVENGKSCTAKLRKQDRKQLRDSRTNIVVKLAKRGRRKHVTTITGLDVYLPLAGETTGVVGVWETLKDVAKLMANK
jgi:translation initiation factor 1 (eIF-1/SUI1)